MAQPGKKSKNYEEFIAKFERKLTTDDCNTPPLVYAAPRGDKKSGATLTATKQKGKPR